MLFEDGNGGDLKIRGADLTVVEGYENLPYLALFGGAPDWWGNVLFVGLDESVSLTSRTTEALNSVALNSSGRLKVELAIIDDLSFIKKLSPNAVIEVNVILTSDDRLDIKIRINGDVFELNWSPMMAALDTNRAIFEGIFTEQFTEQFN